MWVKKTPEQIPGYADLGDDVYAKRWLEFSVHQLLDVIDPVPKFLAKLLTMQDICNFVIAEFEYPLRFGVPTDKHHNNWFDGGCCHQITADYWQTAAETLTTLLLNQSKSKRGIGDCEDVSVLFTALILGKGYRAYECLGMVMQDGNVLGGHGWSIFEDEQGVWRLYEATLDTPPEYPNGYPVIDPDASSWHVGDITYQAWSKFNHVEYYEWNSGGNMVSLASYLSTVRHEIESKRKYKAIQKAWHAETKPLKKAGLLSRLFWRH